MMTSLTTVLLMRVTLRMVALDKTLLLMKLALTRDPLATVERVTTEVLSSESERLLTLSVALMSVPF